MTISNRLMQVKFQYCNLLTNRSEHTTKATLHFCFLYRSPNLDRHQTFDRLDCLSDSITDILEKCPDTEIAVAGDFNVHNVKWLTHSSHTTPEGEYVEIFAISNQLTQLVNIPMHIPCVDVQKHNLLDLFLISHPNKYEIEVLAPLGNSDHKVISASFPSSSTPNVSLKAPRRTLWKYQKAIWDELNEFYRQFDWNKCFQIKDVNAIAEIITNTILLGMRSYIPSKEVSIKQKDRSWFNETCRKAILSKEESFKICYSDRTPANNLLRKKARNICNSILSHEKFLHEQRLKPTKVPKASGLL